MPHEIALEELDFSALIRAGDHIVWGTAPPTLVARLLEQRHRIGPAHVFLAGGRVTAECTDALSFSSFGAMGNRALAKAGMLHVIPGHLSSLHPWFDSGVLKADVVRCCAGASERAG
jgi:hypothetical protein